MGGRGQADCTSARVWRGQAGSASVPALFLVLLVDLDDRVAKQHTLRLQRVLGRHLGGPVLLVCASV